MSSKKKDPTDKILVGNFESTPEAIRKCGISIVEASERVGGSRPELRMVLQELGIKEDDEQE